MVRPCDASMVRLAWVVGVAFGPPFDTSLSLASTHLFRSLVEQANFLAHSHLEWPAT
ncbi:hypothetical protein TIFTF001_048076 [Ficus carica]|uniref:Uncharacterized protein n=1 Tax=Ficus carica TaxID=3494 RepID=A0AA87ZQL3_FICCA|nr:hypothetical protein TIFTF001_048072 [Ficus carica]GMN31214.1 hypothetical protein TIFTF001_048076 [Ficus carica]